MSAGDQLAGILIGESPAIREVRRQIVAIAPVAEPLLVQGATGTGKELVVQAIHLLSGRPGNLTAVNTPAIPETTFEATLFGHTRGAFTGAVAELTGLLGEAHRGTLFLDEIGSFPLSLQPKLLRVTESMQYRPVGGSRDVQGDFRLVCAANEDLESRVLDGSFRGDLLERLGVMRIFVPPLRERIEDVPLLIAHFVAQAVSDGYPKVMFSADAMTALMEHDWPRNVRQLRNLTKRVAVFRQSPVERTDIMALLPDAASAPPPTEDESGVRARLIALLGEMDWKVDPAARYLGVDRSTLYRTLRKLGIRRPSAVGRRLEESLLQQAG